MKKLFLKEDIKYYNEPNVKQRNNKRKNEKLLKEQINFLNSCTVSI